MTDWTPDAMTPQAWREYARRLETERDSALNERDFARARLAEAERDAARWQCIRARWLTRYADDILPWSHKDASTEAELDAAIDAAIAKDRAADSA